MQTSRRGFIRFALLACMAMESIAAAFWLKACSLGDVLSDIAAYIPAGKTAVVNLLNLLGSFGIIPVGTGTAAAALITMITNAFDAVAATITEYNQLLAAGTPNPSLLTKIQDLLQSISDQLSAFVSSLAISDNKIVQLVGALLSLILTTLAGFISGVASKMGAAGAVAAAKTRRTVAMKSGGALVIEPKYRNRAAFDHDWNKTADQAGHPELEIN